MRLPAGTLACSTDASDRATSFANRGRSTAIGLVPDASLWSGSCFKRRGLGECLK